jgi:RNase adapter protein RapZ
MKRQIVIITGLSGSGKSTAARTLEDLGFFCVDNLPVDLLPKLLDLTESRRQEGTPLALVIDLRQREFFPRYREVFRSLEALGTSFDVLFLDADDDILLRRYSETRRQHPMSPHGSVMDGIRKERRELDEIKEKSAWVIDTSEMTVHQLREAIKKRYSGSGSGGLGIVIISFGFGKGLPIESDMVVDVRFLPNPHFVGHLKPKDGRDVEVASWILSHETTTRFLEKVEDLLFFLLPLYIREGKRYLTVSIGCTGGRHRSVMVAEHLYGLLIRKGYTDVKLRHRELAE